MCQEKFLFDSAVKAESVVVETKSIGELEEDDRPAVILSETLFQCGDDKKCSDVGSIDDTEVVHVTKTRTGQICHHFRDDAQPFHVGQRVRVRVDPSWRLLTSRILCGGRLIEVVAPTVYWPIKPIRSCFKPHHAFVEFGGSHAVPSADEFERSVVPAIKDAIAADLPISIVGDPSNPGYRRVGIGNFPAFPCDGVYPTSTGQVDDILVTRIFASEGRLQVRYRVTRKFSEKLWMSLE